VLAPFAGVTATAIRGTIILGPVRDLLARLDEFLAARGA